MKNKILTIFMLFILIVNKSSATENPNNGYQEVIEAYRYCFLNTDYKKIKKMLSPNAVFSYSIGDKVMKYDAWTFLDNVYKNRGMLQQDCEARATVIAVSAAQVMAQIDVNYLQFNNRQKHMITIEKDEEGKWKITNVCKYFFNQE